MRIVEIMQDLNELSTPSGDVMVRQWIITVTWMDEMSGVIVVMRFIDDSEQRSLRRLSMIAAFAEFDGGEGIEFTKPE